jgi:hypothetical protein
LKLQATWRRGWPTPIQAANAAYCFKGIMASTIFDATADGATL